MQVNYRQSKLTEGPCKEVSLEPSEHGGTSSVTFYFDSQYKPVPKEQATRVIIHEYDDKLRSLHRTYLTMENGQIIEAPEFDEKEVFQAIPNSEKKPPASSTFKPARTNSPKPANAGAPTRNNHAPNSKDGHNTANSSNNRKPNRPRPKRNNSPSPAGKTPPPAQKVNHPN